MAAYRLCSIPGCGKAHIARGWCCAHYARWRKHGSPMGGRTPEGEPLAFIHDVALSHQGDDCLMWPFASDGGYGRVSVDGKVVVVSRYVCELVNGPPAYPELDACHSCGNGRNGCCSPKHLSWKTRIENVADAIDHGTWAHGETIGTSKLSDDDVRRIRKLKGVMLQREIAEELGVAQSLISMVLRGKIWTHVTD